MKHNSIKALSIQINLSGLSFCILNRTTHAIELLERIVLEKKATPFELLNQLKSFISVNEAMNQSFDTVTCIYQNELACLVPNSIFDDSKLADYLKFNAKILQSDFISYDSLVLNESANVYIPLVNINNYLFDVYGSFEYKHASSVLIETLLQRSNTHSEDALYINVNELHFEVVCVRNKRLEFYNSFEYTTKEDFIYYILFTIEQLKLNPERIKTYLSGQIQETDELFEIAYKYIRHVSMVETSYSFKVEGTANRGNDHDHFILLNSF
ncbi:DUF3822 family protein [Psychroserpens sp.]|uniref:DUF3822 family protein n=1 Tax=Psychroserpens sp. TaxID=2020870 RepID=UPI001B207036|nr:DUF3822 family protein [Psychroserpens sp.]MBO6606293.1 DUF3822 family protein [Psychroserpens sp.]MBO6632064.1 DUF3822 family protein [Psychroserpens sp.]MBO6652997.1 DUF3822 family protein [Psychroserpens sp.]MBO6680976.1 DUF3822 family protein [Psychroserpens sp.]MBO6750068.1 DUF3822 family protein [Psychroserpens sp.]